MLIGRIGSALRSCDTALSTLIGIKNGAVVSGRLGIQLIGLLDNRRLPATDIVLGGAAHGQQENNTANEYRGACLEDLSEAILLPSPRSGSYWDFISAHLLCHAFNV